MPKEVINVDDYDDSQLVIPYRTTQIFTHHTDMSIPSSSAALMSPIPIDLEDTIDNIVIEPNFVGAWPPSPRSPIDHEEFVVSMMENVDSGEVDMNLESDVEDSPDHQASKASENNNSNPPMDAIEEVADAPPTPEFRPIDPVNLGPGVNAAAEPTPPTTLKVLENIKEDLDSIKENVRQVSVSPAPFMNPLQPAAHTICRAMFGSSRNPNRTLPPAFGISTGEWTASIFESKRWNLHTRPIMRSSAQCSRRKLREWTRSCASSRRKKKKRRRYARI